MLSASSDAGCFRWCHSCPLETTYRTASPRCPPLQSHLALTVQALWTGTGCLCREQGHLTDLPTVWTEESLGWDPGCIRAQVPCSCGVQVCGAVQCEGR